MSSKRASSGKFSQADAAIAMRHLTKCYRIYGRPQDRLKQALWRGSRQYFREFWALRDVSLEIRRGETVGIVGRNGCGKSTLLQLVCGILKPTSGEVEVNGRIAALLELGAGFNPEFTGRDNIYTNAAILGLSPQEIESQLPRIIEFSELQGFIDQPVKTYSSGMFVRLAFAVAISVEPDILVVDEALAVGDEAFQRKCYARIREIQDRGGTILFVSHSSSTVIELCNRAVLLDQGELLLVGRPKPVMDQYHKLLYAKPEHAAAIRTQIQQLQGERGETSQDSVLTCVEEPRLTTSSVGPDEDLRDYFDPSMIPKSTVVYESDGAEILDPHIETLSGRRVNVLVPGRQYVIRYRTRFTKLVSQVRWGTLLKTMLGAHVSGIAVPAEPSRFLTPGSVVELKYRFCCRLMSGPYFANVGLSGVVDGQEKYLHRMVDGLMFRVVEGHNRATVGIADLFEHAAVTMETETVGRVA